MSGPPERLMSVRGHRLEPQGSRAYQNSGNLGNRNQLRRTMRQTRRKLAATTLANNAQAIATHLNQLTCFKRAQHIASYAAFDGEVPISLHDIDPLHTWYLPIVADRLLRWEKKPLVFQRYEHTTQFAANRFGIAEPVFDPSNQRHPTMLDMILVPLVAFDRSGNRLGMGAGYYDRTFARLKAWHRPLLVGIAHAIQEASFNTAPWDVPLDYVITEQEVIKPKLK